MIIDQLPNLASVQETDEIPVERGTTTYKTTLQKVKALIASLLTKADIGLGNVANKDLSNVDNVQQYSADNPPPYPVTSVNGQTGDVNIPIWAAKYTLTLSSSAASIIDDRFTSNACVIITPEYDGSSPLNLCFTSQVVDGGAGNRRLNVYVRTGAAGAVTGSVKVNIICGYQ